MDDTYFPIITNHTHDPSLAWTDAIKNNIILPISNIIYDNEFPNLRGMSLGKYIL